MTSPKKEYWYAGLSKKGDAYVFSSETRYTSEDRGDLRKQFVWVSAWFKDKESASVFLGKHLKFRNPPTKIIIVHQGKVDVQHHSDPKSRLKKNPHIDRKFTNKEEWKAACRHDAPGGRFFGDENLIDYVRTHQVRGGSLSTPELIGSWSNTFGHIYIAAKNPANSSGTKHYTSYRLWATACKEQYPSYIIREQRFSGSGTKTICTTKNRGGDIVGEWDIHTGWLRVRKKNPSKFKPVRRYATYAAWKTACRTYHPGGQFEGNKDIGSYVLGYMGPRGETDATTNTVGEWDGSYGEIYFQENPVKKDTLKQQLLKAKRQYEKARQSGRHYDAIAAQKEISNILANIRIEQQAANRAKDIEESQEWHDKQKERAFKRNPAKHILYTTLGQWKRGCQRHVKSGEFKGDNQVMQCVISFRGAHPIIAGDWYDNEGYIYLEDIPKQYRNPPQAYHEKEVTRLEGVLEQEQQSVEMGDE